MSTGTAATPCLEDWVATYKDFTHRMGSDKDKLTDDAQMALGIGLSLLV